MLGRTLAVGERAVVRAGSEARVAALDEALWASQDPDWLPHGSARTGHAALQPIWLTTVDENPNGARFLFLLDGLACPDLLAWTRVFDLFDGQDPAAVAAARARWTAAKDAGAVAGVLAANGEGVGEERTMSGARPAGALRR